MPEGILSLWRFRQFTIAKEATAHWALIYEEYDTEYPDEKIKTCFHISRNINGKPCRFEQCSVNEDRWREKILDMYELGTLTMCRLDFERTCRKVSKDFVFRKVRNNCQNWCEKVLETIGLESPVTPSNRECGCLYLVSLSSVSESILAEEQRS
jgi:hypothetical protein